MINSIAFLFISILILITSIYLIGIIKLSIKNFVLNVIICTLLLATFAGKTYLMLPIFFIIINILLYIENKKIIVNLISSIFAVIISIFIDTVQVFIVRDVLCINYQNNNTVYVIMHITLLIASSIISYGIGKVIKGFKFNFKDKRSNGKESFIALANVILTAAIFYIITMLIRYYDMSVNIMRIITTIITVYLMLMLATSYLFMNFNRKEQEYEARIREFEHLTEYTTNLETLNTEMRSFRHDYINILTSMSEYIKDDNMKELRKYFNEKIVPLGESLNKKNLRFGLLGNIKIPELKGLITSKVIMAQERYIEVFIDINEEVHKINMDIIDLCRVVGIIMDNAIDSAEKSKNKLIKIALINKKNSVIFIVENSYDGEVIKLHEIFKKGYSTKGENRGLGLYNLKNILSSYENVYLDTVINEDEFIQNIEIKN
ncbi:sensor histidine kinase [Clostridium cavendishii]|nr:GHKL domain-containing protein [Clostridium cavendishii]